jgi:hypothetical protein
VTIVRARYWNTTRAALRYLHTFGPSPRRPERRLWSLDGAPRSLAAARALIERAPSPRLFYGLVLSPDPIAEDAPHDLDLQDLTDQALRWLGRRLGRPLAWVAAEDHEHGRFRHVHVLAVCPRRLGVAELTGLIQAATAAARAQRRARDGGADGRWRSLSRRELLSEVQACR